MLSIAVISGTGTATATALAAQIRDHLQREGLRAQVMPRTVMDLLSRDFRADAIVSTVELAMDLPMPVISGMPLLLATRPELTLDAVADLVREASA